MLNETSRNNHPDLEANRGTGTAGPGLQPSAAAAGAAPAPPATTTHTTTTPATATPATAAPTTNTHGRSAAESASTAATDATVAGQRRNPRYDDHPHDDHASFTSKITDGLLWKANLAAAILHFVQFIAQLGLAIAGPNIEDFTLPLTLTYQVYDDATDELSNARKSLGEYRVAFFLPAFLLASALAHTAAVVFFKHYIDMIGPGPVHLGINRWRWIEYAISSSLMIWPIAAFFGVYDLLTLLLIVAINASTMLFGWLMEEMNLHHRGPEDFPTHESHDANNAAAAGNNAAAGTTAPHDKHSPRGAHNNTYNRHEANWGRRRTTNWLPFIFGCWTAIWPWAVIFTYFGVDGVADEVPDWVIAILAVYFILYMCFAVNQALQYARCGPWRDYRFGELMYIVLSLTAKSFLAWLVFGGTQQDN